MRLVTWGWTDRHTGVALLLVTAVVASLAGLTESPPIPFAVGAAVAACALISLTVDPWRGSVAGLVCAAGLVGLRRLSGHWTSTAFLPALVETLAIVAVGIVAGLVGSRLRTGTTPEAQSPLAPVYGSLGLFGSDAAMARLEEEVERAREHRRPLSLVLMDLAVTNRDLPEEGAEAALRAAARIVESRVGDRDVPFALAVDRQGIIQPEADSGKAWEVIGDILQAMSSARFMFGAEREQRSLADEVHVNVGLAQHGPAMETSDALLDAAVTAKNSEDTNVEAQPDDLATVSEAVPSLAEDRDATAVVAGPHQGRHRAPRPRRLVFARTGKARRATP